MNVESGKSKWKFLVTWVVFKSLTTECNHQGVRVEREGNGTKELPWCFPILED